MTHSRFLVVCWVALAGGCVGDRPAPDCYAAGDGGAERCALIDEALDASAFLLQPRIDCTSIPKGARSASYAFTPTAMGGSEPYTWSAVGLPEGLTLDSTTGEITGVPNVEGRVDLELSITDNRGRVGDASCSFVIAPALVIAHDDIAEQVPSCVVEGQSLLDFVLTSSGDGTPIRCDTPEGIGNGRVPEGISIDPETCVLEGELADARFGTQVFMVRGQQSGHEVWLPYCVTQGTPREGAYAIEVEHSDIDPAVENPALVPLMRRYDAAAPLAVGASDQDPVFRIVDPDSCDADLCYYGFAFDISASLFDADSFTLDGGAHEAGLIVGPAGGPIGFTHGLFVDGMNAAVTEAERARLTSRAWVLQASFDYCLSPTPETCINTDETPDNIETQGNGSLEFAIIMLSLPPEAAP